MVPVRDACRTSWEVSGIFLFVTESGVSHCHFQVTGTSSPLSLFERVALHKSTGFKTLIQPTSHWPLECGFEARRSQEHLAIRQMTRNILPAKHNFLQIQNRRPQAYSRRIKRDVRHHSCCPARLPFAPVRAGRGNLFEHAYSRRLRIVLFRNPIKIFRPMLQGKASGQKKGPPVASLPSFKCSCLDDQAETFAFSS